MKKRLSLLMVLMMIVSLLPMSAFALAGTNTTVKEVTTNNTSENFTVGFEKINGAFNADNLILSLVDKDGKKIGANFAFAPATMTTTGTGMAAATVNGFTAGDDEVFVNIANVIGTPVSNGTIDFEFAVDFKDSDEGDVYLKIESSEINPSNTIFGNGVTTKIAIVKPYDSSNLATRVSDAEKTVSVKGGALSRFDVSNLGSTTQFVRIELDDMDWDDTAGTGTTVTDQAGTAITGGSLDFSGRFLTIDVAGATSIRINPVVKNVDRKASFGDVRVYMESFTGGTVTAPTGRVSSNSAVIGKLVDYAVTMTVTEVNKKDIPNLWGGEEARVKVTLKGPKGSLLNESIDFKVDGAYVRYGLNDQTAAQLTGNASVFKSTKTATEIVGDPHDKFDTTAKETRFKDNEFRINEGTGIDFNDVTEVSFEIVVVAQGTKDGVATITAYQRGLEVTTDLLKATPKFAAKADVTPIKKGEARDAAEVTLTEAKAGLIQKGERITLSFDTKRDYVEHTTKGIKIEATNGMKFDTSSTGIKLVKDGNASGEVTLSILVDRASTGEPAVITVSGINVAVDGSTTDDVVKLDAGLEERTNTAKYLTKYDVSSVDYIKVVKEYDMESILSVFTIGQTAYTVNGETKAAHSAPYIKAGRTMLPIRAVAESLGLTVQWNSATRTASFTDASKVAAVTIGGKVMYVNGTPMPLTVPAELVNDTTFVELRSLATAFGVQIDWDAAAKTATVSK